MSDTEESRRPIRHAGLPARLKDYELDENLSKQMGGAEGGENSPDIGAIPRTPRDRIEVTVNALERENEHLANELKLQKLLLKNKKLKEELSASVEPQESKPKTLKELRKSSKLASAVEKKQKALVGDLLNEDSSDSSSGTYSKSSEGENVVDNQSCLDLKYKKFRLKKNKNTSKSGASRKASDKAVYNVAWPHEYAGSEDVDFANLSIPALVRGENYIIHNIEPIEYKQHRADHLTQLMYLSEQYIWTNILAFHKDVLYEIESGRASWKNSFDSIKARRLNQSSSAVLFGISEGYLQIQRQP